MTLYKYVIGRAAFLGIWVRVYRYETTAFQCRYLRAVHCRVHSSHVQDHCLSVLIHTLEMAAQGGQKKGRQRSLPFAYWCGVYTQTLCVGFQPNWMAPPQETIPGCPQGLEYLTQIDQLLVNQQVELFEGGFLYSGVTKFIIHNHRVTGSIILGSV